MSDRKLCVYHLIDPRNNEVFYVGAGTMRRPYVHEHKVRLGYHPSPPVFERISDILKTEPKIKIEIVLETFDKDEAAAFEKSEISRIGLNNLCNKRLGGIVGIVASEETRAKLSNSLRGKKLSEAHKERVRKALANRTPSEYELKRRAEHVVSEATREKLRAFRHSEESKLQMSKSHSRPKNAKELAGMSGKNAWRAKRFLYVNDDLQLAFEILGSIDGFRRKHGIDRRWHLRYSRHETTDTRKGWRCYLLPKNIDILEYCSEHQIDCQFPIHSYGSEIEQTVNQAQF